jgi:hypothetical protein
LCYQKLTLKLACGVTIDLVEPVLPVLEASQEVWEFKASLGYIKRPVSTKNKNRQINKATKINKEKKNKTEEEQSTCK